MKLKCSKCGKIVNKRKDVFNSNVKILGIDPEDYKTFYLCRTCRRYQYFDWTDISLHPKLLQYPNLIEKYKDKLIWWRVCREQKLTEEFIEKYKDHIDWVRVCRYQKLSEPFIEKYEDKVDWFYISQYQNLSPEFIIKHIDKIEKTILYNEPVMSTLPDTIKLLLTQKFGM